MEEKRIPYYLGIDLNDRYAVISFYQQNSREPDTVSTVAGSEIYQIPLVLAKRKGLGQWYYGEDARKMAKTSEMICVDALLRRAMDGESIRIEDETFPAEELLALFLKKLIQLPQKLGNPIYFDRLVVTVERLSRENMELFWRIAPKMGLTREQFMVIDHRESFYYFALSQQESLWRHDVYLFEYDQNGMF
jgi:molecular chaperone DnaK (HSP70)